MLFPIWILTDNLKSLCTEIYKYSGHRIQISLSFPAVPKPEFGLVFHWAMKSKCRKAWAACFSTSLATSACYNPFFRSGFGPLTLLALLSFSPSSSSKLSCLVLQQFLTCFMTLLLSLIPRRICNNDEVFLAKTVFVDNFGILWSEKGYLNDSWFKSSVICLKGSLLS